MKDMFAPGFASLNWVDGSRLMKRLAQVPRALSDAARVVAPDNLPPRITDVRLQDQIAPEVFAEMSTVSDCWHRACASGCDRTQIGTPLAQVQLFRKKLADMQIKIAPGVRALF